MKTHTLSPAHRVTLIGLFGALTIALSALEGMLPSLPLPGSRLGLANVAVTASIVLLGAPAGALVAAIKIVFVLLTRGLTAAFLSGGGTALAVLGTVLLLPLTERRVFSYIGVSVSAALLHTLGQLGCATVLLRAAVWSYAPLLILMALLTGIVTGTLLNLLIPRLSKAVFRLKE